METATIDPTICRQCRGLCCQGHPGAWTDPERFAVLFFGGRPLAISRLERELPLLGLHLDDWGGVPVPVPINTETGCIFQGDAGCRFSPAERPCQCLGLIPTIDTLMEGEIHCHMPEEVGSGTTRENWRAYWEKAGQ